MATVPERYLDILESTALAYVATIGPQGEPHVSAIWFGWDGTQLYFSISRRRQKYRNLRRDPRIAMAITDPTNPYRSLELRGVARITDDPTHHYITLLSRKYLHRDPTPEELGPAEDRLAIFLEPQRVIVFDVDPSGAS